ncbi:unnamed protein product [Arabis nemorensis]|uniref:Uncharacterized protein n=1 Tax=Arabis nemorensis TaxID=586526 RepID=A0A565C4D1_9BRAS|nr:unnamed protein product [Arabis nemorensis]
MCNVPLNDRAVKEHYGRKKGHYGGKKPANPPAQQGGSKPANSPVNPMWMGRGISELVDRVNIQECGHRSKQRSDPNAHSQRRPNEKIQGQQLMKRINLAVQVFIESLEPERLPSIPSQITLADSELVISMSRKAKEDQIET